MNIPQLELIADEEGASLISNYLLVGKVISKKQVTRNIVHMIVKRVWFTKESVDVE